MRTGDLGYSIHNVIEGSGFAFSYFRLHTKSFAEVDWMKYCRFGPALLTIQVLYLPLCSLRNIEDAHGVTGGNIFLGVP